MWVTTLSPAFLSLTPSPVALSSLFSLSLSLFRYPCVFLLCLDAEILFRPPGLYKAVSGMKKSPTDQGELSGILQKLGYDKEQVLNPIYFRNVTDFRFISFRSVDGR